MGKNNLVMVFRTTLLAVSSILFYFQPFLHLKSLRRILEV